MKKNILNFILIGTLLLTGVVSAFEEPVALPGAAGPSPIDTGATTQQKQGNFWARSIKAGFAQIRTELPEILTGFIIADTRAVAPYGYFVKTVLPGNSGQFLSQLRVGSPSDNLFNAVFSNRAPATVDLAGRGSAGSSKSRDAVALLADPNLCIEHVNMITNTPAFHFWSDSLNDSADILARQIRLSGSNPAAGKVLLATDTQGNATWGTVIVDSSGNPQYQKSLSDVATGQSLCP